MPKVRWPQVCWSQLICGGIQEQGASQVAQVVKNPPANAEDLGSTPGLGRSPGEGSGNPFQYSCLGNLMDRGATGWQIWLNDWATATQGTGSKKRIRPLLRPAWNRPTGTKPKPNRLQKPGREAPSASGPSSLQKTAGKLSQVPDLKGGRERQWLESSGERIADLGASPTDCKPQALRQAPDLCASGAWCVLGGLREDDR